ncbi:Arm DNA-binding domain-containing protein [Alistipes putredinis]|uniref:Arm DNA-binding domain-containing protein n=1 Tax=Alistipes putredinis TaxID=28117 RepID=UPI003A5C7A16
MGKTKTNCNGKVPITLRLTVNGERKEMRIHRFIDPKRRDAAKMEANRSCKALNLSVDTIQSASLRIYRELDRAGKHVIAQTVSDRYSAGNDTFSDREKS